MTHHERLVVVLRDLLIDATGCDAPLEADGNIVDWMRVDDTWAEIDFADVVWRIENRFGLRLGRDAWNAWLRGDATSADDWEARIRPRWTLSGFADFLLGHMPPAPFDAVNIAGCDSLPAGVFLGLQALAAQVDPKLPPVEPGTPILDALRGRTLRGFWARLELQMDDPPPMPVDRVGVWAGRITYVTAVLLLYDVLRSGLPFELHRGMSSTAFFCVGLLYWLFLTLAAGKAIHRLADVVDARNRHSPNDPRTFRDLAVELSERLG